jgi:flagellar hook-associated protein 2
MASIGLQQISGLASGLDTASIISALMLVDRQPQVRIQQKMVVEAARQQALRDVLGQLNSLTTAYQGLTDVGTWADTQSVTSTDDARVSATRTGGAAPGAYTIDVTQLAKANQYTGSFLTSGNTTVQADATLAIATQDGRTASVDLKTGDTLDVVAGKINGTTGSPVYASVLNGALVLSNKATGTANAITSVTVGGGTDLSFGETQSATDAQFTIDSKSFTRSSNVVDDALAGVTLNLKGVTTATVSVGSPGPDTDAIQKKLQDFVTQYNTTLDFLQSKLEEQPVANPVSDADRTKGVLRGDSALTGLVSSLRNAFSDLVTGRPANLQTLAQAGLSTGKATGTGSLSQDSIKGKLSIDSAAFSAALTTSFSDVKALFTNVTGSYASEGLAQRLGDLLKPWTASSASNGLLNMRIDGETTTLSSLQAQSINWDERLKIRQEMLQKQFVAMETALGQAQSQGSWLDGQIAQLNR